MMFCPKCGKESPDTAKFCGACGQALPQRHKALAARSGAIAPLANPAVAGRPAGAAPVISSSSTRTSTQSKTIMRVVAVVLVALMGFGIVRCATSSNLSVTSVGNGVASAFENMFSGGADQMSSVKTVSALYDLMPSEVVQAAIRQSGCSNKTEMVQKEGAEVAERYDRMGLTGILDKVDAKIVVTQGERLDGDELDRINETYLESGLDIRAIEGVRLEATCELTLLEDFGFYEKGETVEQSMGDAAFAAVKIGGKWYLWAGSIVL